MTTARERAREIVIKGLDDPWGHHVSTDIIELLVKDVTAALREERARAFEEAALICNGHLNAQFAGQRIFEKSIEARRGE